MRKIVTILVCVFLAVVVAPEAIRQARAQADPYPAMAPLEQYLMPKEAEIALARSAAPGGMCYMMSKHQYLNDQAQAWYPHVMFYGPGDTAKTWGADLPGSPMIAVNDPEGRVTTFMIVVHHWSDGTPGPE
jgi:hypothetical protein